MKKYLHFFPAIIHTLITFYTDKSFFTFPENTVENAYAYNMYLMDYSICKILVFLALLFFYKVIFDVIVSIRNKAGSFSLFVVKCGLPYLLVMLPAAYFILKSHGFSYVTNDESIIFNAAKNLQHYLWFTYITTYYYIVSLMIIPSKFGPIIIKLIIEFFVVGYFVYRFKNYCIRHKNNNLTGDVLLKVTIPNLVEKYHLKEKYGIGKRYSGFSEEKSIVLKYYYLTYIPFLLYPFIAYTTSAHRLPIYFLLYLVLVTMLVFDRLEEKKLDLKKAVRVMLLFGILANWRTEGVYLFLLSPILLILVYKNLRNVKMGIATIVASLFFSILIYIPQNVVGVEDLSASATDRMKPFYGYTIVNLMRNGLDTEKNAEDLAIIDKYMSLEKIQAINDYYGDINYEDTLILYEEGFVGVREDATVTDFFNYAAALDRIFKNNPDIFLKTRMGAFNYAALPYKTVKNEGIVKLIFTFAKSVMYNLYIPLLIIAFVCLYALFRKRFFTFFLTAGVLCHWFIVFILAPASYFKYYFPVYMTGYFYLFIIVFQAIYNAKALKKITFLN